MNGNERSGKELRYCYRYPHPSVTTDCVIFGFDGRRLHVLLVQRGADPYKGWWAFPGGFLNMEESAEEGALRELQEETGLREACIRQFHAFTAPQRDPRERVITIAFYALVRMQEVKGGDDAADARWFALDEVPPLAFDHDEMLLRARQALHRQMHFEPVGAGLLPEEFTLDALLQLYEALWETQLDRHNFCRSMQQLGLIEEAGEADGPAAKETGRLFRLNREKYDELTRRGEWLGLQAAALPPATEKG